MIGAAVVGADVPGGDVVGGDVVGGDVVGEANVVVGPTRSQVGTVDVLVSNVTAAPAASARP